MSKQVFINTWAKLTVELNTETNRYEVVSASHPTNEELTTRLHEVGVIAFGMNGEMLDKDTLEPYSTVCAVCADPECTA